jgi:deazaflavin-dependent oxidoreductase (nitroreductase family)
VPQIITILGAIVLGLAALVTAFLLGWRAKSPLVLRPIIALSKRFMNPKQMRSAGTPGAYAGIIRHRGRVSGTAYETPIGIVPDGASFLVALPYGTRAQWLRNVLAAGTAIVVHEGRTCRVDAPELIPMTGVANHFSTSDQGLFRWMRVDQCLRMRNLDADTAHAGETAGRAA